MLELKHRCIDRRHRQFVNENDTAVEEQESRSMNSLTLAPYNSSDTDFIVKEQLPVELGFFLIANSIAFIILNQNVFVYQDIFQPQSMCSPQMKNRLSMLAKISLNFI